jgi:long-chain acyl-CoA synthetase
VLIERLERIDGATLLLQNNREISGRELASHARALAGALAARGVSEGDRVAMVLPNCKELVIGLAACLRLGATPAPIEPASTAPELARALIPLAPHAILVLTRHRAALADALPALAPGTLVVHAGEDGEPGEAVVAPAPHQVSFEELIASGAPAPSPARAPKIAHLSWRGRGKPLYALLDAGAAIDGALAAAKATGLARAVARGGMVLAGSPFHRPAALALSILAPIELGVPIVVLKQLRARMLLRLLGEHDVRAVSAPPALISLAARFHEEAPADLSRIQSWVATAAPPPEPARAGEIEATLGRPLAWGWGAAEAPWALAVPPERAREETPAARGLGDPIAPSVAVRVLDPNDPRAEAPIGLAGPLAVSAPWAARAFVGATDEDAPGDGWVRTGDRGLRGKDGRLRLSPRAGVCTVAAYEVDLEEVAAALREHPKVATAEAIPIPDPDGCGSHVSALVALAPDAQTSVAELIDFLRTRLAYYKVPQAFRFRRVARPA